MLVTDRADHALQLHDELAFWLPEASRYIFSEPNPLFYEEAAWGTTTRRERLQTLTGLAAYHLPFVEKPASPPIIVTSARALMTRTLPRRDFLKASKQLKVGQSISLNSLLERVGADWLPTGRYRPRTGTIFPSWRLAGYLAAVRAHPVRLDFFGDEIDTIRRFDPGTQRTVDTYGGCFCHAGTGILITGYV